VERKVCNICREEKELCDFSMNKSYKSGVYNRCKQCESERGKEYHIKNREKNLSRGKEYYIKNKEKQLSRHKEYNIKNKEKIQSYNNEYKRNRKLNDPIFKLVQTVRVRLCEYLNTTGITKNKKTFDIVGCTPNYLKEHLEIQFTHGMSWENHGLFGWHIDHIVPLSSAKTEEDLYKLCHYTNLQPLWAKDNLSKSNKLDYL
jgi:hypothetical protein